jgi:hypothetical protein
MARESEVASKESEDEAEAAFEVVGKKNSSITKERGKWLQTKAVETASLPSTAGGQPKTLHNHNNNKVTTKVDPITALQESIGKKFPFRNCEKRTTEDSAKTS